MPITHHVAVSEGLHFACLHVHFVPKHSCCFCLLFLEARDSFFPCCPQGDGNCNHNLPAETCRFVFADSMWSAIIFDTWGHECRGKLWRLWFDTCCALVLCWKTCQFLKQQTKVFADLGPYFFYNSSGWRDASLCLSLSNLTLCHCKMILVVCCGGCVRSTHANIVYFWTVNPSFLCSIGGWMSCNPIPMNLGIAFIFFLFVSG